MAGRFFGSNTCCANGVEVDPLLFAVDFSLLADGGHPSATFATETAAQLTNRGFTFARSTVATVQSGPSSVVTGIAADAARIGSKDGTKRGLILEPSRFNGLAPNARTLNWVGSSPPDSNEQHYPQLAGTGGVGSLTLNAGAGPDGNANATAIQVTGGIFNEFGTTGTVAHRGTYGPFCLVSSFNNLPLLLSVWVKSSSTQRLIWSTRAPWDQNTHPEAVIEVIPTGSGLWQRLMVARTADHFYQFGTLLDGTDLSSQGSGAGQLTTSGLYDLAQLEVNLWGGEIILTSDGISGGDRADYPFGSDVHDAGRISHQYFLYPRHASTENVSYSTSIGANTSIGGVTLYSFGSGTPGRAYVEIIHNNGTPGDANKLHIVDVAGVSTKSNEQLVWSRDDKIEIFVSCGNSIATSAKYRVNGGAWVALTFSGGGAVGTMSTSGTIHCGWDGSSDANTGAMVLEKIWAFRNGYGP